MKKRPAIKGGFKVLVVPSEDVSCEPTIPITIVTRGDACIRVVAKAERGDVCSSPWAFTKAQKLQVCKQLRELAGWLENPDMRRKFPCR